MCPPHASKKDNQNYNGKAHTKRIPTKQTPPWRPITYKKIRQATHLNPLNPRNRRIPRQHILTRFSPLSSISIVWRSRPSERISQ